MFKKVLWVVLMCLLFCSLAGGDAEPKLEQLRVMTFNVRVSEGCEPQDRWELRRDRQIDLIREYQPDVIGFQEVLKEQLDFLIDSLTEYSMVGEGLLGGISREHNAIFFRRDLFYLREAGSFTLPNIPDRVSWTRLSFRDGQEFYVLNTHLHQNPNDPLSWNILLKRAHDFYELDAGTRPIFLLGDMNSNAGESVGWMILNCSGDNEDEVFKDAWLYAQNRIGPVYSFGFEAGCESFEQSDWIKRIDWILFMGEVTPVTIETITSDLFNGRYSSDHRPVQVTFEFSPVSYKPPELENIALEYLEINVSSNEPSIGETFAINVTVRNHGGIGYTPIDLIVNDTIMDTQKVFFNMNERKTIKFEISLYRPGEYTIKAGESEPITVKVEQRAFF